MAQASTAVSVPSTTLPPTSSEFRSAEDSWCECEAIAANFVRPHEVPNSPVELKMV